MPVIETKKSIVKTKNDTKPKIGGGYTKIEPIENNNNHRTIEIKNNKLSLNDDYQIPTLNNNNQT